MTTTTVHISTVLLPFNSQMCGLMVPRGTKFLGATCQMGQIALHMSCTTPDAESEQRTVHVICGNVGQQEVEGELRHLGSVAPHMIMHAVHVFEVLVDEYVAMPPPTTTPTKAEKRRMN